MLIPLRSAGRLRTRPWVTWLVVVVNAIIWLTQGPFRSQAYVSRIVRQYGLVPAHLAAEPLHQAWTLVTSMFLHGGWVHVIGNLWFLWVFGSLAEDAVGHVAFLAFYLTGGVAATLAQALAIPASTSPLIGAAGAIATVMGMLLILAPKQKIGVLALIWVVDVPIWFEAGVFFLWQLFNSVTSSDSTNATFVSLAGILIGVLLIHSTRAFLRPGADYIGYVPYRR